MQLQFRRGVMILAALAVCKLGYQEYVFRTTAEDIIIATYGKAAQSACAKQAKRNRSKLPEHVWRTRVQPRLVVGNANLDVAIWQVNHRLWNARFRDPYLRMTTNDKIRHTTCDYDIQRRTATIAGL